MQSFTDYSLRNGWFYLTLLDGAARFQQHKSPRLVSRWGRSHAAFFCVLIAILLRCCSGTM
jgi:hypothetical protein